MAKLVITQGGRQRTVAIDKSSLTLGRGPDNDVVLKEKKCSRKHLSITMLAGVLDLVDLGSANGTFYEGERIQRRQIKDGDVFTIGAAYLQFFYEDDAVPDASPGERKKLHQLVDRSLPVAIHKDGTVKPIAEPVPHVELLSGGMRGTKIALLEKLTIGRKPENRLQLDGKKVSGMHAEIDRLGEDFFVRDLGSTNGTQHNGRRMTTVPERLSHGDFIDIGDHRFVFRLPGELRAAKAALPVAESVLQDSDEPGALAGENQLVFIGGPRRGQRVGLGDKVTLGRHAYNTLVIQGEKISNHHAEIRHAGDRFVLRDLKSTNGTYVNGRRVREHTLAHDDVIVLGPHVLAFEGAGAYLDVDDRLERMRAYGRNQVVATALFGALAVAFAVFVIFLGADLAIEAIAPAPALTTNSAPEDDSRLGRVLGFERDPDETEGALNGVVLRGFGQAVQYSYASEDPVEGATCLKLTPKGATRDPATGCTLTTTAPTERALLAALGGKPKAVSITIKVRTRELAGVVGLRALWRLPGGLTRGVCVAWGDAEALGEGAWRELTGITVAPRRYEALGFEVFCRGMCESLELDAARVAPAELPKTPRFVPVVRESWSSKLEARVLAPGVVGFTRERRQAIQSARLSLLVQDAEQRLAVHQAPGLPGSGPVETSAVMGGVKFASAFFGPYAGRMHHASVALVNAASRAFLLRFSAAGTRPAAGEVLAYTLQFTRVAFGAPDALRLFRADGTEFLVPDPKVGGLVTGVAEVSWGQPGRSVGIACSPPADVLIAPGTSGPLVSIIIKRPGSTSFPELEVRPYTKTLREEANGLIDMIARIESRQDFLGDAWLLVRDGLDRYPHYPDIAATLRERWKLLDGERARRYGEARAYYDNARADAARKLYRLAELNNGLAACNWYLDGFRAYIEQAGEVTRFKNAMNGWKALGTKRLNQAERELRRRTAQDLWDRAVLALNSEQATLKAYIFFNAARDRAREAGLDELAARCTSKLAELEAGWENDAARERAYEKALADGTRYRQRGDRERERRAYEAYIRRFPVENTPQHHAWRQEIDRRLRQ